MANKKQIFVRSKTTTLNLFGLILFLCSFTISCGGGSSDSLKISNTSAGTSSGDPQTNSQSTTNPPESSSVSLPELAPEPDSIDSLLLAPAILPFNSDDSSVILRSSLTSQDSITSAGGYEESSSANIFDPILGMQPASITAGTPGCRFTVSTIPALADLPTGQLSIEVERGWLSISDSNIHSIGEEHSTLEYLLSYSNFGQSEAGKIYMEPPYQLTWLFHAGEGSRTIITTNTKLSPDFARITLSWTETTASLYIDGLLVGSLERLSDKHDNFSNIYLGNFLAGNDYQFASPYYIRNLIVSTKPVKLNTHPLLEHIMLIGDSFAAGQPYFNVASQYDGTISNNLIRNFALSSLSPTKFTVYSNGGGKIQDSSNDPLQYDVNGSGKTRSEAISESPTLIIFVTGGNDFDSFNKELFTTDLHDHIEAFLGVNGYPKTSTLHVIVTTTVSGLHNSDPTTIEMKNIILDLESWWNSTYPNQFGSVSIVNTWDLFGGSNLNTDLFLLNDAVHPAPDGNIIYGDSISSITLSLIQ